MGEYGTYEGQRIKIGTCEDMYYLRADQIPLVQSYTLRDLTAIRFRFPFPDEDNVKPGEFDHHDRGFPVYVEPPTDGVDHGKIQFAAGRGILVMLPCPYSEEGKAGSIKYMYNGYGGPSRIVQQRAWNGVWATVLECGACDRRWRLPELTDAAPVIEALIAEAERRPDDARRYKEMALRVGRGYSTPVKEST